MAVPFLNWLVDIMLGSSPSRRLIFAAVLRGVNPAQTPRYYRTVSLRVSRKPRLQASGFPRKVLDQKAMCTTFKDYSNRKVQAFMGDKKPARRSSCRTAEPLEHIPDRGDIAVGSHARDHRVHCW